MSTLTQRPVAAAQNAVAAAKEALGPAKGEPVPHSSGFERRRISMLFEAASDSLPEKYQPYAKQAAPVIGYVCVAVEFSLPFIVIFIDTARMLFKKLPYHLIQAIVGFGMCFFGGVFPATIAAGEAWKICGGSEGARVCRDLYDEFQKLADAHKEDDAKDDDGDGKADVNDLNGRELLARKTLLTLRTVEPERINDCLAHLYTGWVGVLASLKIEFARTIMLGQVIGDQLYKLVQWVDPYVSNMMPEEYRRWGPVCVRWFCKIVAVSLAWWIQRVISAFHSAIRGGLLFTRAILQYLNEAGICNLAHEDTYIDEVVGWGVAGCGIVFQFYMGFAVPFPLSLFTWPFSLLEMFIVWSVNYA